MPKNAPTFLADESLEQRIVSHLKDSGYDTKSVSEAAPSINDESVLKYASAENRIIVTNDKGFGDLIFLNKLPHKGVILLRFRSEKVQKKIKAMSMLLKKYRNNLAGSFIVVEDDRVRFR